MGAFCKAVSVWSWRTSPYLYERIEELSIRSGRSIPEIIQALISRSFLMDPAETVFREAIS